ncbi:MAG: sugar ABC transporter ATP-binding protein, partial [Acidimicrobiales bacterium]
VSAVATSVTKLEGKRYVGSSLTKSFDGAVVLHDATVTFEPGEIHSIIGENGAGKSTLVKILSGVYQPDSGTLALGGERLIGLNPHGAQQRGIYLVPQEPSLMASLSVTENLFVGILRRARFRFFVDWKSMRREASGFLNRVGLDIDPEMRAEELSVAQQQLVECARALVHRCQVIFFDEPTSPLTEHEADTLFEVMRSLRESDFTLGFISHRLDEVLAVSDRLTVLRDGKIVMREARAQYSRPAVVSAMVGREIVTRVRERGTRDLTASKEMLAVKDLTSEPYFRDVSFTLRAGEILGLGGLVGSGRTEIAETIYGLRSAERGRVEVEGVALAHRTPRDCVDAGLIYLPEDRGRHGIFAEVEVTRNVTAGVIHRLPGRGPLLRPAAERRMAEEATKTTAVRMPSIDALMKTLSGGNQQRSMLARWLLAEPKVAIFDEPTRGVDVGAKDDIWTLVNKLAHEGLACLLISSELTELTVICDRVLVIYEGSVVGELSGDDITDARLGAMVVGPVAR